MLDRARERVSRATSGRITTIQADIREVRLPDGEFDIVLAAAVLHHLRTDEEWRNVFTAFHRTLRLGGSRWVFNSGAASPSWKRNWRSCGADTSNLQEIVVGL